MSRTWDEKVAYGRRLVAEQGEVKWKLGDLANEVCPATANGTRNDDALGVFSDEIGISRSSLKTYRYVASQWPAVTRVTAQTWTAHRQLAEREDRFDIINEQIWTYNSLATRLGRLPNPSRVNKATGELLDGEPAQQPVVSPTAAISEALATPETTEQMMQSPEAKLFIEKAIQSNPKLATAADNALDKRAEESRQKYPTQPEPTDNKVDQMTKAIVIARAADRKLKEFAGHVSDVQWTDQESKAFEAYLDHFVTIIDMVRVGLNSGSWDDELADLLSGGEQ